MSLPSTSCSSTARSIAPATARALALLLVLDASSPARAEPPVVVGQVRIAYTPRVFHVTSDDAFVDWNHIVALEWISPRHTAWHADRSHFGISVFDNSYGQFSQSIYFGLEWDWRPAVGGRLFVSVSPGLVHGYREPYEDKLPLNKALGVGLTIVPAIGWQSESLGCALSLAGSAVALRVGWSWTR